MQASLEIVGPRMGIVKILAVIILVSLTLGAGLEIHRRHLVEIAKDAWLLARAVIANFIIIPILGVLLARAFALSGDIAIGFLLMAIAPGVPFVMAQVKQRGGDPEFAAALALLLPLLSLITIPLTAALVLPADAEAKLPIARFMVTLVLFQLLPLIAGVFIRVYLPALAEKLARPLQLVFLLSALLFIGLLSTKLAHAFTSIYGSRMIYASLALTLASMGVGWLMGGPLRANRRTLGIGTTLHNIGLCALITTSEFARTDAVAAVIVYFVVQFVVTTGFGIYFKRTAKVATA